MKIHIGEVTILKSNAHLIISELDIEIVGDQVIIGDLTIDIHEDVPVSQPALVFFGVPHLVTSAGDFQPMAIKISVDAIAAVPLIFKDQAGHALAGHLTGVRAVVADPTMALAEVTSDGQWVQITPLVATGASTVTYFDDDDNISTLTPLDFSIVLPNPSGVEFNEAGVVMTANPNPPSHQGSGGTGTTGYTVSPAGVTPNPVTGRAVNPVSGLDINATTGLDINATTGADIPAVTPPASMPYTLSPVGVTPNPVTGRNVNPVTGNDINATTGLDIDSVTGADIPPSTAPSARGTASARRTP